jgi:hypothetical protein
MIDIISSEELVSLTGYKRKAEQYRWLVNAGVHVRVNAAGNLLVHKSVVEKWLGCRDKSKLGKSRTPNFDQIK